MAVLLQALGGLAVVAGLVTGVAVVAAGGGKAPTLPEASGGKPQQRVSFLSRIIPPGEQPEKRDPAAPDVPRSVQDLARRLPVDRKVAQLFLVGFSGKDLNADVFQQLRRLDLGGIALDRSNYTNPNLLGQLAGEAVVVARKARRVPPFVMASQQGGDQSSFPNLPPAKAPGDLDSSREGGAEAGLAAQALRALNVTGVLGPSVDVGDDNSPVGDAAFSDEPKQVAAFADAVTRAYRHSFVFASPSHFPGLGAADVSPEQGPATVGLSPHELVQRDLIPFQAAIRAGAPAITLSNATYSLDNFTLPGSLSRNVIELLRKSLHFKGVVMTDDLSDPALASFASISDAAVDAIRAGADMIYISGSAGDQRAAYVAVLRAVQSGRISTTRLDQAVLRILEAKRNYRLIR
ncbi:MAG TPA: glycoside hydrolase family 3 N-terminal domain-containing protein [Thermoleophilaceae bacterium]|nr:glycoside hydrolase family 3 N-terminal domain-containing protein [Thermoleophilaceae bacterium]